MGRGSILTVAVLGIFVFLMVGVSATDLSACQEINSAGTYNLISDISNSSTCININVSNVILDCRGFSINYSSALGGSGIITNRSNTTIRNCFIKLTNQSVSEAYDLFSSGTLNIENSSFNNSRVGFQASGSLNVFWYINFNTSDSSNFNARTNVNVSIYDSAGNKIFSSVTGHQFLNNGTSDSEINMSKNILLYHFNESSGNVIDYSGVGYNGESYGLLYGRSGILNSTALSFNGSAYMRNTSFTLPQNNFSFSFWFYLNQNASAKGGSNGLFGIGGIGTGWDVFQESSNNKIYFANYGSGANLGEWYPSVGNWHHLACSTSDSNIRTCYGDGSQLVFAEAAPLNVAINLTLGTRNFPTGNYLNGSIDEFAIFNRTMSAVEMLRIYNLQKGSRGDYDGSLPTLIIQEYMQNSSGIYSYTPHNITANRTEYDFYSEINYLNSSKTIAITQNPSLIFDYPSVYTLFQRDNATEGIIKIMGHYYGSSNISSIEASFNNGTWKLIDPNPLNGRFSGNFSADVGQGNLLLRDANNHNITGSISNISIGDLFLIAGQSNADGQANTNYTLNISNRYFGVKFMLPSGWIAGGTALWSEGSDPSSNSGVMGSPWPRFLDQAIPSQNIPIGFIAAAVGGTNLLKWNKYGGVLNCYSGSSSSCYSISKNLVSDATNGTMKIKAVILYQGEADVMRETGDVINGSYLKYKGNLSQALQGFYEDYNCSVLVGQINPNGLVSSTYGDGYYNVTRAQQESWGINNSKKGAITWDIKPDVGLHYINSTVFPVFAERWTKAILREIYGNSSLDNPNLIVAYWLNATRIRLVYDTQLSISDFLGTSSEKALGFDIIDGENHYNDSNIIQTSLGGNWINLDMNVEISNSSTISIGNGARFAENHAGKAVLRSYSNGLVVPMEYSHSLSVPNRPIISLVSPGDSDSSTHTSKSFNFNVSADLDVDSCSVFLDGTEYANTSAISESETNTISISSILAGSHSWYVNCTDTNGNEANSSSRSFTIIAPATEAETPATSSGSGLPTYYLSDEKLAAGYEIALAAHFQTKFNLSGKLHFLKINNLTNDRVNITISSDPITFILQAGQTQKVDVNSDNIYDLSVFLKNISGARANLIITSLSEAYEQNNELSTNKSSAETGNEAESPTEPIQNNLRSNILFYSITAVGIIILTLVAWGIFLWVLKKRQLAQPIVPLSAVSRKLFGVHQ